MAFDAAPLPRPPGAPHQGAVARDGTRRTGPGRKRAAYRACARASATVAKRRPKIPDRRHSGRPVEGINRAVAGGVLQYRGECGRKRLEAAQWSKQCMVEWTQVAA